MIIRILPTLKSSNKFRSNYQLKKNTFSYEIHNTFSFTELESHYYYFSNLPKLSITLVTTAKNKKELIFILSSFQFILNNKH